jgi:adhesin transport system membrane fusion protein
MFKKQPIKEIDLEYMSDTSAAMLQGAPIKYHTILISAVAFLLIATIWANYAVLDVVTSGEGRVIPSSNIQMVQNLEGGIIKDLRVKPGDIVERDQILMIIDDVRFATSFRESEIQLNSLRAKINRLHAETQGLPLKLPAEFLEKYPRYAQNELELYADRQRELEKRSDILKEQVEQKRQELLELEGRREQLRRSLELVQRELDLTKPLVAEGAVSEVEILRLERTVNDLAGELESAEISVPRIRSTVDMALQKIEELNLSFRAEARAELNAARAEFDRLIESTRASEDRFTRTRVRSPVRGTVNRVLVNTTGAVVQPGEDLIEIVPLNDTLLIEANIRPADIGFLRPQLPATVKISAYDFSIYGGLTAHVEHISADTITNERDESFYQIRVRTTEQNYLIGREGEKLEIIPGMGATVDILTGEKTVLEYLLKPILKARKTAMRER